MPAVPQSPPEGMVGMDVTPCFGGGAVSQCPMCGRVSRLGVARGRETGVLVSGARSGRAQDGARPCRVQRGGLSAIARSAWNSRQGGLRLPGSPA